VPDQTPRLQPVPNPGDGPSARLDAEQAVLGAILLQPDLATILEPELEPADFNQPRHETIWRTIHAVNVNGTKPDPIIVADRLVRTGQITSIGGAGYLHQLLTTSPLPSQALHYARIVRDTARLRTVAQIATQLNQVAATASPDTIDDALATALDRLDTAVARFGPRTEATSPIGYLDFTGLFTRPRQAADWITAPLIAAGRVTLLYSPGKAGKSLLAMEAAAAVAAGRSCLATERHEPRHVLYLDQEMTEDDWADRLADMGYNTFDETRLAQHLHLAQLQAWPPLDTRPGGTMLQTEATRLGATVVIVDTISKLIAGEENSNDTQQALYRHTIVPLKRAGIAVLILDHTGKDIERGARGGSAKTDNIDLAFELLLRGLDKLTLRCTHARFRDDHLTHPTFLHRENGPLTHTIEDRAPTTHGDGLRPTHLMEKVSRYVEINPGVSKRLVMKSKIGKETYVESALELLVIEGYIETTFGPGRKVAHTSVKPFREDEQE
jgi:hypothetical protein